MAGVRRAIKLDPPATSKKTEPKTRAGSAPASNDADVKRTDA
jgi:hypothetical protein